MQEQAAAINKPLPKPIAAPTPINVSEPEAEEPEYTPLDAALDQISGLQSELVIARMGDIPEEQKTQAAERFVELEAYIKTLEAALKAVTNSRDQLMEENSQMKRQMAMQRKEIDKLKKTS
jgi:septal ring factor EnvC (AmiA/AmiB activator)